MQLTEKESSDLLININAMIMHGEKAKAILARQGRELTKREEKIAEMEAFLNSKGARKQLLKNNQCIVLKRH